VPVQFGEIDENAKGNVQVNDDGTLTVTTANGLKVTLKKNATDDDIEDAIDTATEG
jgi:hypothetical protein